MLCATELFFRLHLFVIITFRKIEFKNCCFHFFLNSHSTSSQFHSEISEANSSNNTMTFTTDNLKTPLHQFQTWQTSKVMFKPLHDIKVYISQLNHRYTTRSLNTPHQISWFMSRLNIFTLYLLKIWNI